MKKHLIFLVSFFMLFSLQAQDNEYTAVGELADGLIAVQKDGKWGFIDTNGDLVIDLRDDLVAHKEAPVFTDGRCLIHKMEDGIAYYGYIDTDGNTVIAPQYLNTTPFTDGYAIALKVEEKEKGTNQYLNKKIIDRNFDEVLINTKGEELKYLTPHKGILLDAKRYKQPEIVSRMLAPGIVTFKTANGNWKVAKL
ncbi:WG repeat-containing protein [Robertkochia sediminum]|uniref:WG repeat-containing protein n=1 Tax=Robertkochia sediminum TaxID=2785326 RepID=UPI0019333BED|nr:WG repeat-containing protein [Robertkochia sediminum]MBL7473246.1 WG repeat-containing protein [Robertkochia sediminum]